MPILKFQTSYISDGSRSRAHLILKRRLVKSHLVMPVFVPKKKEVKGDGHSCVMTNCMLRTCRLSLAYPLQTVDNHEDNCHVGYDIMYLVHMHRRFSEICCLRHQDRSTLFPSSVSGWNHIREGLSLHGHRRDDVDHHLQNSQEFEIGNLCYINSYVFITFFLYLPTHLLHPSRVRLDKLTGLQIAKKFPAFYGPRRFFTAFTSARHLSLS